MDRFDEWLTKDVRGGIGKFYQQGIDQNWIGRLRSCRLRRTALSRAFACMCRSSDAAMVCLVSTWSDTCARGGSGCDSSSLPPGWDESLRST